MAPIKIKNLFKFAWRFCLLWRKKNEKYVQASRQCCENSSVADFLFSLRLTMRGY